MTDDAPKPREVVMRVLVPHETRTCLALARQLGCIVIRARDGFKCMYQGVRPIKVQGGRHEAGAGFRFWLSDVMTRKANDDGKEAFLVAAHKSGLATYEEEHPEDVAESSADWRAARERERAAKREQERARRAAEAERTREAARLQARKAEAARTLAAIVALDLTVLDDDGLAALAARIYEEQKRRSEATA